MLKYKNKGLRRCYSCKKVKSLSLFGKRETEKGTYLCKECTMGDFKRLKEKYNHKEKIFSILGKKCNHCGVEKDDISFFDIDHIIPVQRKTRKEHVVTKVSEIKNLQILCPNCHRLKTIMDRANGWK